MTKYAVTPKGQFHWAHVGTPDTTYKAEGQYHVKLQLSGQDAETMRSQVDKAHADWKSEVNKTKGPKTYQEFMPYKVVLGDDGLEAGIQFHFKMKASGVNSRTGQAFTQRPMVVGPDKTPLPTIIKIANGSMKWLHISMVQALVFNCVCVVFRFLISSNGMVSLVVMTSLM